MSGSSLDGLDIAHVQLEEVRGQWSFSILHADCIAYNEQLTNQLKNAANMSVADFLKLDTSYGHYLGTQVKAFIDNFDLEHQVHFIVSHGHTVFHDPQSHTTYQIGKGANIAAVTELPVINDLRAIDVALGGQGAPIVPIGDKLLFGEYDFLLNIGGIANITFQNTATGSLAFDVCPANQVLNSLALRAGKNMDEGGAMAAAGSVIPALLQLQNDNVYYSQQAPKSLSNEAAMHIATALINSNDHSTNDLLHTACVHIATMVANAVKQYGADKENMTMLVTGGGAFNTFLVHMLQQQLNSMQVNVVVPDADVVHYKEAVIMALIGVLRWREDVNVLSSVTDASKDSVGGCLWFS